MLVCDQTDHDNEEILTVCLNMNCKSKRACCQYCIEKHQSHKKELKTLNKLKSWQKESYSNYQAFRQKMDKIQYIIKSSEKYLSDLSVEPEISFEDLSIDDFEDYISKLIKIQQISQPFNKLLSDLLPQLEPLNQLLQQDDTLTISTQLDQESTISETNNDKQLIAKQQQSQQQLQYTDEQFQQEEKKKKMKKYIYQELIEKTYKIRSENELDIHQYPTIHKISIENLDQYKTIILIGTSNSGKQQLINVFLNYYYGVEYQDPFRFELIDNIDILKDKQNNEYDKMKVYYITPYNGNPGLRIIYTPDYSEDLIYEDQFIEQKIYRVLQNTISLNQCIMIGFVISKDIGISQYFMLESILSKFSNNLINNIVFLFPDCTLDNPIQKDILLSKTHLIDEMQSPVVEMIPTITNSWYLKFRISTLFIQNNQINKQENKQLWEMGKKSFQQLIHQQLQYKLNLKKSDQIRNYYNSFLNTFGSCVNSFSSQKQQFFDKFNVLYQRETFGMREYKQKLENFKTEVEKNINNCNALWVYSSQYFELNNGVHYKNQYEQLQKELQQIYTLIKSYCNLIQDQTEYNKEFQEFYNQLKQYTNCMSEYLMKVFSEHTLHFQFNSILISIQPCQYKYYYHLIKQEKQHKQEGWENRCEIFQKRSKFFLYFDDCTRGSKQLVFKDILQKLADYQFERKRHPDAENWCKDGAIILYYLNFPYTERGSEIYVQNQKPKIIKKIYNCVDKSGDYYERQPPISNDYTELIQPRISGDCDKHFNQYINQVLDELSKVC